MIIRSTNFCKSAVAAVVLVALATGPAAAQPLDKGAIGCRKAISKAYSKLVNTAFKTVGGCHKGRNIEKIEDAVNCNDISAADVKGTVAKSAGKMVDLIAKKCPLESELINDDYYLTCPAPCAATAPDPMTNFGHVGACLTCLADSHIEAVSADALDTPTPPLSVADAKCAGAIVKGYGKYLLTALKERTKCQGANDKLGNHDVTDCETADPKAKISGAVQKALAGLQTACAEANLTNVASCSTVGIPELHACLMAEFSELADTIFSTTYVLPTTLCPTGIRTVVRAGSSVDGPTQTTLSVGWTGLGHAVDITDKYSISSDLTCPGPSAGSCGNCTVDGIAVSDPKTAYYARCLEDRQVECDNPFGVDAVNCSGGPQFTTSECAYFLGTPLPISAGGVPTCTLNRLFEDVTGTANPDDGSSELNLNLRALVHLGGGQTQPCSVCSGDKVAQDGLREGVCVGGHETVVGDPCDVQAFDLTFSTTGFQKVSGLSLDCPPVAEENISGSGLIIDLPLTTGTATLAFEDKCDGANSEENCGCGVCSVLQGLDEVPCRKNSDCSDLGLGTCTNGSGPDRAPNNCTSFNCQAGVATDRGTCVNPIEKYCDGFLRANGRGVISCATDGDCDSLDCPGGGCGTCDHLQFKSCYLNPIVVEGEPDRHNPVLAGTFCLPPTANTGVNSAAGSPGPGEVKIDMLVDLSYD